MTKWIKVRKFLRLNDYTYSGYSYLSSTHFGAERFVPDDKTFRFWSPERGRVDWPVKRTAVQQLRDKFYERQANVGPSKELEDTIKLNNEKSILRQLRGKFYDRPPQELENAPKVKRCECGAHKIGSQAHSSWCPVAIE